MGSRTTLTTIDQTRNDASTLTAVTGARVEGDGNTVTLTDSESVKNALLFAQRNSDGTFKTTSDLLSTSNNLITAAVGYGNSLADQSMALSRMNTAEALDAVSKGTNSALNSAKEAYAAAENKGLDINKILLVVAAIAGMVLLMKGRK